MAHLAIVIVRLGVALTLLLLQLVQLPWGSSAVTLSRSQPRKPQLGGLSSWNTDLAEGRAPRVWTEQTLAAGLANRGSLGAVRRVLDKLRQQQPISVTVFGSSMVKTAAGCFHSSEQALWQHDIVPNPTIYHCGVAALKKLKSNGCGIGKAGFMTSFMQTINSTWPHVDHIMFNNGRSGMCLDTLYKTSCMDALTPKQVDIVVLDTVTIPCSLDGGEAMLRDMLLRPSQPLVILFSNGRSCGKPYPGGPIQPEQRCPACIKYLTGAAVQQPEGGTSVCDLPGANKHIYSEEEYLDSFYGHQRNIDAWQRVAEHYNVPHLDLNAVMAEIMHQADKLVPASGFASDMELLAQFYHDHVHYNAGQWGTLLAADLLVYYLAWAQQQLNVATPDSKPIPSWTSSNWPSNGAALSESAGVLYFSKCYGLDLEDATQSAELEGGQSSSLLKAHMLPRVRPTGGDVRSASDPHTWAGLTLSPYPPLPIIEARDFYMQVFHVGARGEMKLKPGYHAQKAGARIVFEVDTSFAGMSTKGSPKTTEVWIAYLKSYRVWGIARVSCISGCWCRPLEVNAASREETSVSHVLAMHVTPHPACRMALQVLTRTKSGGHYFKLLSVSTHVQRLEGTGMLVQPATVK